MLQINIINNHIDDNTEYKNDCYDVQDGHTQPDYLKFVFTFILDVFKDFEGEVGSEGRYYSVKGAIEEVTNQTHW